MSQPSDEATAFAVRWWFLAAAARQVFEHEATEPGELVRMLVTVDRDSAEARFEHADGSAVGVSL